MKESQSRVKLYFSVFVVDLVFFASGCLFGWTSPSLAKLQSPDSWLPITDAEASWIVSFLPVGAIFGSTLSGLLLDSLGRKATVLMTVLLLLGSWLLLAIATSVYIMYVARLAAGFSCGIAFAVLPIYIAEIAEDSVRSAVNTVLLLFVSSGILVIYCIGPYISYLQLIIVCAAPCIIFLSLSPWLCESPYYLVYKNDMNKAISTLRWLRGNVPESRIEQEIKDIQVAVADNASQRGTIKDMFGTASGRMATFIVWGLFFWQQMSGITVVTFYTEPIFKMTGSPISTSASAIIFGVFNVIVGAVSPPVINHFGYKKPLIASAALMFVTHTIMAVFLYLALRNYNVQSINWVPVVMLTTYIIAAGIGFANVPWAVMGELFPTNIKAIGAGLSTCFCSAVAFITSNIFPDLVNLLGIDYVFALYGLFCLCAVFFVIFLVPDTNGLSLVEIQKLITNPKYWKTEKTRTGNKILEDNI